MASGWRWRGKPSVTRKSCFLLKVISDSSAATTSFKKLVEYTAIPSVERYVLLEQNSRLAVVYKRQLDVWLVERLEGEGEINLGDADLGSDLRWPRVLN